MKVFFDTEFTSLLEKPKLISIGLISEDGSKQFYAELSDTYNFSDVSDFAKEKVIPLLDGSNLQSIDQLKANLLRWIEEFETEIVLATDSFNWDWPIIIEIFGEAWPKNLSSECYLLNMNYMKNADAFYDAVKLAYENGLKKHHAMHDAIANRLGWIASENG
jgi:hypothetical protein